MTTEDSQHLEAIQDIRNMMRKSTRFLSLSGLSGVFAGIYALIGAFLAHQYISTHQVNYRYNFFSDSRSWDRSSAQAGNFFYGYMIAIAAGVLFLSIVTAYFFTNRKAKRQGQTLFDHTALRALVNLGIPLMAGGAFCTALLFHGTICYIAPAMLLFYGLALINASKYTYDDIRYLGICQIVLGLINAFDLGHGLIYWAIGFGVLHIAYGTSMWFKYERKERE
jgi:hypothetical protein